jgi:hypothetical protein
MAVWEVEDTVEEDVLTFETDDSLFWLEEIGRALVMFSFLFAMCASGF